MRKPLKSFLGLAGVGVAASVATALAMGAAQSGPVPKVLISGEPDGFDGWTMSLVTAEVPAGAEGGWHYHNGNEIILMQEGASIVEIKGEAPRTIRAGEAYIMQRQVRHRARNASKTEPYKMIAFLLDEKGKPQRVDVEQP